MAFGKKFDREVAERQSAETSASSIWNFQKGSTVIRLLDDLDEWTEYWEHYDKNAKAFFPCVGRNEGCVGCENELDVSHKWLANAVVISSPNDKAKAGYVNLFKFPKSIMSKVIRQADRNGTLLEHEYEVIRDGNAMDTEYDLERGEKTPFDFDKHMPFRTDHEAALQSAFAMYKDPSLKNALPTTSVAVTTPPPWVTETPKVQAPVEAVTTQAPPLAAAGFTADQLAAAAAFMSAQAQQAPAVAPTVAAPAKDIGAPPTEPHQAESSDASGEADEVLDEDSVRRMDFASLLALAVRAGLEPPDTIDSQTAMADWLVKELTAE